MGAASVIATIGFGATVFMLRVLVALLCERVSWSRDRNALVEPPRRKDALQILNAVSDRTLLRDLRSIRSDDCGELLEKQNHEKGEYESGLTALNIGIISGKFGGRAVRAKHGGVRWERSL
ncbi:MAG: hypothetical protein WA653_18925 [Candidatus Sulfotelmatobacter sp.]